MLEQRLDAVDGPGIPCPELRLYDEPVIVQSHIAGDPPGSIFSEISLEVFFAGGLEEQLVRQPVRQDQVKRKPHRHVDLVLVAGNRRAA